MAPIGEIITQHTHYERRRRPVKSTLIAPVNVSDEQIAVADTEVLNTGILDDDRTEEVEYKGQEWEIHGLAVDHADSGSIPEGARKRRRTQGVSTILCSTGLN
jgi:hypothetical protein